MRVCRTIGPYGKDEILDISRSLGESMREADHVSDKEFADCASLYMLIGCNFACTFKPLLRKWR